MDDLWTHLSDHGLHIDVANVPNSCLCMLCNSIMRHPVSTKCGCVFCEHCMRDYLLDDRKPCPGCLKENEITEIEYDNDVTECKKSRREISRLVVTCLLDGCEESFELRALLEHLISCSMMKSGCLLKPIGCSIGNMNSSQLAVHLSEESMHHYKLIVDALCEMKNGYEAMQTEREDVNAVRNEMSQMKEEQAALRIEMNARNNEMMTAIGIMAGDLNATKAENVELIRSVEQSQNMMETIRKDFRELKISNGDLKCQEIENLTKEVNSLHLRISEFEPIIGKNTLALENLCNANAEVINNLKLLEERQTAKENDSHDTSNWQGKLDGVVNRSEKITGDLDGLRKEIAESRKSFVTKGNVNTINDKSSKEIYDLRKKIKSLEEDLNNLKANVSQQKKENKGKKTVQNTTAFGAMNAGGHIDETAVTLLEQFMSEEDFPEPYTYEEEDYPEQYTHEEEDYPEPYTDEEEDYPEQYNHEEDYPEQYTQEEEVYPEQYTQEEEVYPEQYTQEDCQEPYTQEEEDCPEPYTDEEVYPEQYTHEEDCQEPYTQEEEDCPEQYNHEEDYPEQYTHEEDYPEQYTHEEVYPEQYTHEEDCQEPYTQEDCQEPYTQEEEDCPEPYTNEEVYPEQYTHEEDCQEPYTQEVFYLSEHEINEDAYSHEYFGY